jgi:hypothetical protein
VRRPNNSGLRDDRRGHNGFNAAQLLQGLSIDDFQGATVENDGTSFAQFLQRLVGVHEEEAERVGKMQLAHWQFEFISLDERDSARLVEQEPQ